MNNNLEQITYAEQISHNEESMLTGHYLSVSGGFPHHMLSEPPLMFQSLVNIYAPHQKPHHLLEK